uniref:Uncharacterized protein n=1 Tax=Glossina pallidipes TaxID=7398 RepID=A0A1A9Z231_GLOPL
MFLPGKVAKKPHQSNRPVKIDRNQKHSSSKGNHFISIVIFQLTLASFELSALLLLPDVFDGTAGLEDLSLSKFIKLNACALPYDSKPSLRPDYMQKRVRFCKLFMHIKNELLKWLTTLWRFPPNLNLKMSITPARSSHQTYSY